MARGEDGFGYLQSNYYYFCLLSYNLLFEGDFCCSYGASNIFPKDERTCRSLGKGLEAWALYNV